MRKFLRLAALVSCLGVLVLGAIAVAPNGPLLSSFWGCSAGRPSLAEEIAQRERLDRLQEATLRRLNAIEQIAEEVIARRRSLAEAMEQFRALDQEWPQFNVDAEKAKALGISEDEWVGRRVIGWVRTVLDGRPDEAAAVVGRLEKELQELLADRKKRPAAAVEPPIEPEKRKRDSEKRKRDRVNSPTPPAAAPPARAGRECSGGNRPGGSTLPVSGPHRWRS
jgi:hypothetical protein